MQNSSNKYGTWIEKIYSPSVITSSTTDAGMSELSRHLSVSCKGWERIRICDRRKADFREITVPLSEGIVKSLMSSNGVIA